MTTSDRLQYRRPRRWPLALLSVVLVWAALNLTRDGLPSRASAVARPPSKTSTTSTVARAKQPTPSRRKSNSATTTKPAVASAPREYTIAFAAASFRTVSRESPNVTGEAEVPSAALETEREAQPSEPEVTSGPAESTIADVASESPKTIEAPPPPAPVVAETATAPPDAELSAVGDVLVKYQQAYTRLDAKGAAAVWPGVDTQALTQSFAQFEQQNVAFDECSIVLAERTATAHCLGLLEYVRVGNNRLRTERRTWTIELLRQGEDWRIVNVASQ